MKKYIIHYSKLTLLLLFCFMMTACEKDKGSTGEVDEKITVSQHELQIGGTGSTMEVSFTSNVEWTVKSDVPWLSVAPASGTAGEHRLTVVASANYTEGERSGKITIQASKGQGSNIVSVLQEKAAASQDAPYAFIDRNHEWGDALQEWDAVILGREDSLSYWYQFSDGLPSKLAIWNNDKAIIEEYVKFDSEGLPSVIAYGDYMLVFANFKGNTFDFSVTHIDRVIYTGRDADSDIDWDEYKTGLTQVNTRAPTPLASVSVYDAVRVVNLLIGAVQCGTSIATAVGSGGVAIPIAVLNCGSLLINVADFKCNCIPPWLMAAAAISIDCIKGNLIECMKSYPTAEIAAAYIDYLRWRPDEAKNELLIDLSAEITERNVSYFSADAIVTVNVHPDWYKVSAVKNEFGIIYSTDPKLSETNRDKKSFLVKDGIQRITFEDLDPCTTYYYCSYIVYNGTISYGEIKSFTTKKIKIILESPEQGKKLDIGKPVNVVFRTLNVEEAEWVPNVLLHFESSAGHADIINMRTDNEGSLSVIWSPNQKGATLAAQLLGKNGRVLSDCIFAPNLGEEEEFPDYNFVGSWTFIDGITVLDEVYDGYRATNHDGFWTFYSDGTASLMCHPWSEFWTMILKGTYKYDSQKKVLQFNGHITEYYGGGEPIDFDGRETMWNTQITSIVSDSEFYSIAYPETIYKRIIHCIRTSTRSTPQVITKQKNTAPSTDSRYRIKNEDGRILIKKMQSN